MNNNFNPSPCPCYPNAPYYNPNMYCPQLSKQSAAKYCTLRDYGPAPFVVNIHQAAEQNNNFRLALWTDLPLTTYLNEHRVGEEIGLEMHPNVDQFLRIEEGQGLVRMGDREDC